MNFFLNFIEKIPINGIIHVGANEGQEVPMYQSLTNNIILFEPLQEHFETLKNNYKNCLIFNFALGNKNEKKFLNVASNNGESSSLLKPIDHLSYYKTIKFDKKIEIEIKRYDELDIDHSKYNVLVTDTQGYDLNVLIGFGNYLNTLDVIIVEYINTNLYENNASLDEITTYLKKFNFNFITKDDECNGAGNALFLK